MSPGAQNTKTRHDTLGTVENESSSAKHENGTLRPWYRRKRVREQNMQPGPDALGTAENEFGSAKHEKGTRRPGYRGKRVRKRKT
jgi:hypothetical protein